MRKRSQVTTSSPRPTRLTSSDSPISVAARRAVHPVRPVQARTAARRSELRVRYQHAHAPLTPLALTHAVHPHATAGSQPEMAFHDPVFSALSPQCQACSDSV
jgi:hypothetical protein